MHIAVVKRESRRGAVAGAAAHTLDKKTPPFHATRDRRDAAAQHPTRPFVDELAAKE
jgi:hypothetical protein